MHFGHLQQHHPNLLLFRNYMELPDVQPIGWDMCLRPYQYTRAMRAVHLIIVFSQVNILTLWNKTWGVCKHIWSKFDFCSRIESKKNANLSPSLMMKAVVLTWVLTARTSTSLSRVMCTLLTSVAWRNTCPTGIFRKTLWYKIWIVTHFEDF